MTEAGETALTYARRILALNDELLDTMYGTSWPNWDGTTQVRAYEMNGDELSWKVPPRPDGSIPITVLRRAHGMSTEPH